MHGSSGCVVVVCARASNAHCCEHPWQVAQHRPPMMLTRHNPKSENTVQLNLRVINRHKVHKRYPPQVRSMRQQRIQTRSQRPLRHAR